MADLLVRRAPSTAASYHQVRKLLYAWLVEEEKSSTDPMVGMRSPIAPEGWLKRLSRACVGNTLPGSSRQHCASC